MSLLIIDYGMGNLASVKRSFEKCGADVVITDDAKDLRFATHIVLPGVGAFADGMANLQKVNWGSEIKAAVLERRVPILGICLGMHLLASSGHEGGEVKGLGLIPGEVRRLEPDVPSVRIPHVGWNEIHITRHSPLFIDIADGTDFYFVHSYHFIAKKSEDVITFTPYCGGFTSAVMAENIFGVQFHPEKSSTPGFQLLRNFLSM